MEHTYKYTPPHNHYIDGKRVVGVSTIAKISSSPDPLMYWAAAQVVQCLGDNTRFEDGKLLFVFPPTTATDGTVFQRDPVVVCEENYKEIYKFAKGQHTRSKEAAADRGNRVHDLIHQFWLGKECVPEPDIQKSWDAFLEWKDKWNVRPLFTEQHVYSVTHMYAGIYDLCALLTIPGRGDVCFLIDYKTSKSVYENHIIQSGGYKIADDEIQIAAGATPVIEELGILSLHPTTGYPLWIDLTGYAPEIELAFIASVEMYRQAAVMAKIRRKFKPELDKALALLEQEGG